MMIVNNSRRPAIITMDRYILVGIEKILKFSVGPNNPKPSPVFDKDPVTALIVVIRSLFSSETTKQLTIRIVKYTIAKEVIFDTVSADIV